MKSKTLQGLLVAFLACLTAPQAHGVEITHVQYISHGAAYHEYIQTKARAFEALHPGVTVNVIIGNHERVDVMMVSGTPPDVIDLPDYVHLALDGLLVDLLPLLERDGLIDKFRPETLDLARLPDGKIYTMPFLLQSNPTYFNRDLFKEAGLPAPDELGEEWSWETVLDFGKKLTIARSGESLPASFGVDRPWSLWRIAVHQAGGRFYDDPLRPTRSLWDSPEVLEGIRYVEQIYRAGITPHLHVPDQTLYYFWTGKTAIDMVDGPGIIGAYLKEAPFDWDFALQPRGPGGRAGAVSVAGPHILTSTQNLSAVWEWMKFITVDEANVEEFVRMTGLVPALTAAQPAYPDAAGIAAKNYWFIFEQTLQPNPFNYMLPRELSPRFVNPQPVWEGQMSPQEWLTNMHRTATALIDEMRGD